METERIGRSHIIFNAQIAHTSLSLSAIRNVARLIFFRDELAKYGVSVNSGLIAIRRVLAYVFLSSAFFPKER